MYDSIESQIREQNQMDELTRIAEATREYVVRDFQSASEDEINFACGAVDSDGHFGAYAGKPRRLSVIQAQKGVALKTIAIKHNTSGILAAKTAYC